MNYFSSNSAAERYSKGRPYFHPTIVWHIKEFLSIAEPLSSALDVGCGTGLSTVALQEIAQNIIGVDASAEMIALAPRENGIRYFVAPAENLPFEDNEFDLITLSQVFHWLNRDRFLSEANRVLFPDGWLIAYDNYFSGQMVKNPEFHRWFREEYLARYPAPSRAKIAFTAENTNPYGFRLIKEKQYENTIRFSLEGLIDYLVTQSNIIAAVEGGRENIEEVRTWLTGVIKPMFRSASSEEFLFSALIWYLQCAT
jgi:ubiquinone/menaquinone biosynthesis C-methylase UbiE